MSDVKNVLRLPPDPGLVSSLGNNHSLETAFADLIDNSVDAGATQVQIIFETERERLSRVFIHDDGHGMDHTAITNAMTLGHRRTYSSRDLGHFGLGLKAASFAHATILTVWSTSATDEPVGRRIHRVDFSHDFSCEVLSSEASALADQRRRGEVRAATGTTVEWTNLNTTYHGNDWNEAASWLDQRQDEIRTHLGITFHRLITAGRLDISTRTDEVSGAKGVAVPVCPIDPMGYRTSGCAGYPKTLMAHHEGREFRLTCHIWPPKSSAVEYRLGGTGEDRQGFFVYRNDRLLQAGGWSEVVASTSKRRLARIVLDGEDAGTALTMNAEKHGLRFSPNFHAAVHRARATDGTDFTSFLMDAESAQGAASKRTRSRKPAVMPDKGFDPRLRRVIAEELPTRQQTPLQMRWKALPSDDLFNVDLDNMTLQLNNRYRALVSGSRHGLNDAPLLKALLYLLTHELFEGDYLGAKDKDDIALYQTVLTQAVLLQGEQE